MPGTTTAAPPYAAPPERPRARRPGFGVDAHRRRRLEAYLMDARVRVDALARSLPEGRGAADALDVARHYLDLAAAALERGDTDAGWFAVRGSDRQLLQVASRSELVDRAMRLAAEGEGKLTAWRQRTVRELCQNAADCEELTLRARLVLAQQLHDEHGFDRYHKIHVMRAQLGWLGGLLAVLLAGVIAGASAGGFGPETTVATEVAARAAGAIAGWELLAAVALFGALGGTVSASIGVARNGGAGRVPEQLVSGAGALIRPLIGATGATAFAMFLQAGLGFASAPRTLAGYTFLAFVAGFSERLVAQTVDAAADRAGGGKP